LPSIPSSLLDKRLIFVTGKGGVGKSTVSAALGLAAVRALDVSSVDTHTLRAGAARLPDEFLEALGLDAHEISALRALYGAASLNGGAVHGTPAASPGASAASAS
jgi:anion-transporting  ArsA/GET3 family ATPase